MHERTMACFSFFGGHASFIVDVSDRDLQKMAYAIKLRGFYFFRCLPCGAEMATL
jgi:hypothetical protein